MFLLLLPHLQKAAQVDRRVRRLQPHQTSRHRKYTPRRPEEEQTKGVVKHGYVQQKLLKRLLGIHHGIRVQISLSSSARLAKCAGGFHVYVFCRKPKHFRFVYNLKKRGAISWLQGEHAKEFAGFHSFDEKCAWQTWTWRTAKTLFYFLRVAVLNRIYWNCTYVYKISGSQMQREPTCSTQLQADHAQSL